MQSTVEQACDWALFDEPAQVDRKARSRNHRPLGTNAEEGDIGIDTLGIDRRHLSPAGAAIVRKLQIVGRVCQAGEAVGQSAAARRKAYRAGTGGIVPTNRLRLVCSASVTMTLLFVGLVLAGAVMVRL
ncbi:hypothetical protein GCM10011393_00530 [Sphingopyxis bauzanensis]|nr:hypothetical protein GCM10011393_00530 [Sphingopyxis bauzanensis]